MATQKMTGKFHAPGARKLEKMENPLKKCHWSVFNSLAKVPLLGWHLKPIQKWRESRGIHGNSLALARATVGCWLTFRQTRTNTILWPLSFCGHFFILYPS